jgi:hypothetical protein
VSTHQSEQTSTLKEWTATTTEISVNFVSSTSEQNALPSVCLFVCLFPFGVGHIHRAINNECISNDGKNEWLYEFE